MNRFLTICLLSIFLNACDDSNDKFHSSVEPSLTVPVKCGNYNIELVYDYELYAIINNKKIPMLQIIQANGVRYDGQFDDMSVTLLGRGEKWMLKMDNQRPITCRLLQ